MYFFQYNEHFARGIFPRKLEPERNSARGGMGFVVGYATRTGRFGSHPISVLSGYSVRQHSGDSGRCTRKVLTHGDQLLRNVVSAGRLFGRSGGDAVQRPLRGVTTQLVFRH